MCRGGLGELLLLSRVASVVVKKSDLITKLRIQPRDLRFSTASSLYVRGNNIILRLQVSTGALQ